MMNEEMINKIATEATEEAKESVVKELPLAAKIGIGAIVCVAGFVTYKVIKKRKAAKQQEHLPIIEESNDQSDN